MRTVDYERSGNTVFRRSRV